MRMKNEFTLVGVQPMKFEKYDVTQLFLELPLTNGRGCSTVKHDFATSEYYEKHLKDIDLPVQIMLDFELVSTGKSQKTVVHGFEILKKSQPVIKPSPTQTQGA